MTLAEEKALALANQIEIENRTLPLARSVRSLLSMDEAQEKELFQAARPDYAQYLVDGTLKPFANCSHLLGELMSPSPETQGTAIASMVTKTPAELLFLIAQLNTLAPAGWAANPESLTFVQSFDLLDICNDFALSGTVKRALWQRLEDLKLTNVDDSSISPQRTIVSTFHQYLSISGGLSIASHLHFLQNNSPPLSSCDTLANQTFDAGILPSGTNDSDFAEFMQLITATSPTHAYKMSSAPLIVSAPQLHACSENLKTGAAAMPLTLQAQRLLGAKLLMLTGELAKDYAAFPHSEAAESNGEFKYHLDLMLLRIAVCRENARHVNTGDVPLLEALEQANSTLTEIRHRMTAYRVYSDSKSVSSVVPPPTTTRTYRELEDSQKLPDGTRDEAKIARIKYTMALTKEFEDDNVFARLDTIASVLFADNAEQGRIRLHYQGDTESTCHQGLNRSQSQAAILNILRLPSSTGRIDAHGAESGSVPFQRFTDLNEENYFEFLSDVLVSTEFPLEWLARSYHAAFGMTRTFRIGNLATGHTELNPMEGGMTTATWHTVEDARQRARILFQAACENLLRNALNGRHQTITLYSRAIPIMSRFLVEAADHMALSTSDRDIIKQHLHIACQLLPDNIASKGDARDIGLETARLQAIPATAKSPFEPDETEVQCKAYYATQAFLQTGDEYSRMFLMDPQMLEEAEKLYSQSISAATMAPASIIEARIDAWAKNLIRWVNRQNEYWTAGCATLEDGIAKRYQASLGSLMDRASFQQQYHDAFERHIDSLHALPGYHTPGSEIALAAQNASMILKALEKDAAARKMATANLALCDEIRVVGASIIALYEEWKHGCDSDQEGFRKHAQSLGAAFTEDFAQQLIRDLLGKISYLMDLPDDLQTSEDISRYVSTATVLIESFELLSLPSQWSMTPMLDSDGMTSSSLGGASEEKYTFPGGSPTMLMPPWEKATPFSAGGRAKDTLHPLDSPGEWSVLPYPNFPITQPARRKRSPQGFFSYTPETSFRASAPTPITLAEIDAAKQNVFDALVAFKSHGKNLCKRAVVEQWAMWKQIAWEEPSGIFGGTPSLKEAKERIDAMPLRDLLRELNTMAASKPLDENIQASLAACTICNDVSKALFPENETPPPLTRLMVQELRQSVVEKQAYKDVLGQFRQIQSGILGWLILALSRLASILPIKALRQTHAEKQREMLAQNIQQLEWELPEEAPAIGLTAAYSPPFY